MTELQHPTHSAFVGSSLLASGPPEDVARAAKRALDLGATDAVLIFDDATGHRIDIDLSGPWSLVVTRMDAMGLRRTTDQAHAPAKPRKRGRPRLGVVSKEVTLLPRHWAWLGAQRGGASATLRRLVDEARRQHEGRDRVRRAQDAAYRFMTAMVGDEPGFEEGLRALYTGDAERFHRESEGWPPDVRDHVRAMADAAFPGDADGD